jgi:RHS repeat-associated protein
LSYTYDNQNRLRDIYHLLYPLVSYTYYADGQRSSKAFSNGTSATYQYDSSGRLFTIDETNAPDRVYTYDRRDRPTAISSGARFSEGFQYFSDGQLQRYDRIEPLTLGPHPPKRTITQTFEYDASGNRTTASAQGTYTTDDANQYASVSGAGATSFDYDSVGNTTSRNNVQYTYDALWRVKTAKKGSTTIEFTYDALGRLSATKTNGVRRSAVYVNGHPTTWYNAAGISVEETFWGNRGNEPLFTWRALDNLEFFYHLDAQNNVTSITDWYTGAQEYYFFDPFGSPHYYAPTGAWSERTSSTINPPYLYTGQPWIASVGMYNYGARLYDPQHGRFLQPDPSFLDGGDTNLYRYVKNNPYTYVDRDGRVFETLWDLANFSLDVASLSYNLSEGSYGWAALDVAALAVDGLAALTPVLPGGAGAAIKTLRGGEEAIEAAHGVEATAEAVKGIGEAAEATDIAKAVGRTGEGASRGGTRGVKAVGPGRHAGESIPARGPKRDFTRGERDRLNEIGRETGCHTCGTKTPGTKSGDFVPDHQPPNSLNPTGADQRLFPQCINCSRVQGGELRGL